MKLKTKRLLAALALIIMCLTIIPICCYIIHILPDWETALMGAYVIGVTMLICMGKLEEFLIRTTDENTIEEIKSFLTEEK